MVDTRHNSYGSGSGTGNGATNNAIQVDANGNPIYGMPRYEVGENQNQVEDQAARHDLPPPPPPPVFQQQLPPPPAVDPTLVAAVAIAVQQAMGIAMAAAPVQPQYQAGQNDNLPRNWYSELRKAGAPIFEGTDEPLDADKWIKDITKMMMAMQVPETVWTRMAVAHLSGSAEVWYETVAPYITVNSAWEIFKDAFLEHHFPAVERSKKLKECLEYKQAAGQTVLVFTHQFDKLCRYAGRAFEDEFTKISVYQEALRPEIRAALGSGRIHTYAEAVERALEAEKNLGAFLGKMAQAVPAQAVQGSVQQGIKRQWSGPPQQNRNVGSSGFKKPYTSAGASPYPVCNRCGNRHVGECRKHTGLCFNCGKPGHLAKDCRSQRFNRAPGTMNTGATAANAPKPAQTTQARVFCMDTQTAECDDSVVTGSTKVNTSMSLAGAKRMTPKGSQLKPNVSLAVAKRMTPKG